jgi:hypothetical protein
MHIRNQAAVSIAATICVLWFDAQQELKHTAQQGRFQSSQVNRVGQNHIYTVYIYVYIRFWSTLQIDNTLASITCYAHSAA